MITTTDNFELRRTASSKGAPKVTDLTFFLNSKWIVAKKCHKKTQLNLCLRLHLGLDGTGVESLRYEDLIINADSKYCFGFPITTEDKCDTAVSGYIEHPNRPNEKKNMNWNERF